MAKLTILGTDKPRLGKEEKYSISMYGDWLHLSKNPFITPMKAPKTIWHIMVQTKTGWRRAEKNKEGLIVPYTFNQKSLMHKGIKIVVEQGENSGELIVHPQRAKEPKITKVELLDGNYKPIPKGKQISYRDTIIARAHCVEMFKMNVAFTLWEDDAQGEGHDPIKNALNKINLIPVLKPVNEKGIAEAVFRLPAYTMAVQIANARIAAGDKNEGKTHEYYVTADIVNTKIQKASPNVNVTNPNYNPEPPKRQRTSPQNTPQQKPKTPTPPSEKSKPKQDSPKFPVTTNGKSNSDRQGKILSAEFVDNKGNKLHSSKVGKTVIMKITAKEMKNKKVKVIIWEEDNFTWTNDEIYNKDWILTGDINFIGVSLTKKMFDQANDGGGDSQRQQYFIEVIYDESSVKSSVMPITLDAEPTKIPKGKSDIVIKGQKINKSKEICFCNRDFEEKDVRKLVKLLKGSETIWEGQALKVGKRAACNISDKTFTTLTKELNATLRKYKINTCAQKMHFLAQTCEETGTFALSEETKSKFLSSQSIYKGRGLLQLTGVKTDINDDKSLYNKPGPYKEYSDYKGDKSIITSPEIVANNVHYCIDSGGWIWSINQKMTNDPKSQAITRWGKETLGKSLNELAIFVDKYLELISVLLNGRNKETGMPNGWEKRKSNYNTLKTFFFMFDKFHGDNNKTSVAKDIITYHIFNSGKIERHIPKNIKAGFENKYKYVYHDENNKEHDVCIVDWLEIDKVKREKPNPISIPKGYISHESFNILGVNQKNLYKYSDGTVIASGDAGEGGGTIRLKFVKAGGKAILVKLPDPLNYNSGNVKINLSFENTIRKYMGRDHLAALIGALAQCGLPLVSEGSAMKDGTCFPSVSHTNGESIDSDYFTLANTQKYINAMADFGIKNFYYKPGMKLKKPVKATIFKEDAHHKAHLHCGSTKINVIEIKE